MTPLWCASVANKLEVVKTLIKHNADVNASSDTKSTPVRSACYMTNIDVVKLLVENGADIHKPNINGGTCLINSVQSVDLCQYLIQKGTNVNAQDNSGNLALHYAIREGRFQTVKLLLKHGSLPYVKNDFGDDAIQTASLRGYSDILDYLISKVKPPVLRQVEAYELMATNFVDEKHDIQRAIQTWKSAMELRFKDSDSPIHKNSPTVTIQAYDFKKEAGDMDELLEIVKNPDDIYMQALLIRERILGPNHKDTIFGLMYRGAVYADTHCYQRCVDLWKYAFKLRHERQEPLNHECLFTLQALCKLFWEIHDENDGGFTSEAVRFSDVSHVLEMGIGELGPTFHVVSQRPIHFHQQEEFDTMLKLVLHLVHLLCKLPKDTDQTQIFHQLVHKLIRLDVRDQHRKTLLHLAVDWRTSKVTDEYYSSLPSLDVVQIIVQCGADVNAMDNHNDTPLHACNAPPPAHGQSDRRGHVDRRQKAELQLEHIVQFLVEQGAHVDARNDMGVLAGASTGRPFVKLNLMDHITLKCLAATAVRKSELPYKNEIPQCLAPFILIH